MISEPIYHIVTLSDLETYRKAGLIAPESLTEEGFIHCSFKNQVYSTIQRLFPENEVRVLELNPEWIKPGIVIENSYNHGDFPHIYGPIPMTVVTAIKEPKDFIFND